MPSPEALEWIYKNIQDEMTDEQKSEMSKLKAKLEELSQKIESKTERKKLTLSLDFDGVIHSYISGWKGIDIIPDPPVEGAIEFLYKAIQHFDVCIYSTRSESESGIKAMQEWLAKWEEDYRLKNFHAYSPRTSLLICISFPTKKPLAFVGIDDRIITFDGKFPDMETLKNFKPWNKR
jgi:hypothetical protein